MAISPTRDLLLLKGAILASKLLGIWQMSDQIAWHANTTGELADRVDEAFDCEQGGDDARHQQMTARAAPMKFR